MPNKVVDAKSLERLRNSLNQNSLEFLNTDIETALILAAIARNASRGSDKRERNIANARRAYDAITRLAKRVKVTPEQAELLDHKLEKLKTSLQQLGETF
jgi:hypothetical protein